jgi:hypothetical protein
MRSNKDERELELMLRTVELGTLATFPYADSPENSKLHEDMRKNIIDISILPKDSLDRLKPYITRMVQILHMSRRDYEAALKEIYRNDPEGVKIIDDVLTTMSGYFQDNGFGVIPNDFLPK